MSPTDKFFNILIAEDNDVSRQMMASILKTKGYRVFEAIDGSSAIKTIQKDTIDLAYVDINMAPEGGFEFIKHMVVKGIKIPVVIVTSDTSGDILMQANALGVKQVLNKPVEPERLLKMTQRVLERDGHNVNPVGVETYETKLSPEQLMQKALDLAKKNVSAGKGGPFAAIVADQNGKVLGSGASGAAVRVDPTAHAEVMAIRQAAEKLGQTDLSGCVLFSTSEPTAMGKALIESVGITQVYFGLEQDLTKHKAPSSPTYTQMHRAESLSVYQEWQAGRAG